MVLLPKSATSHVSHLCFYIIDSEATVYYFRGAKIHLEKSFFCFCDCFLFLLLFTRFMRWIKQNARNHANSSRCRGKVKELQRKRPTIKTTPVLLLMTVTVQAPAVQFNWKWLAGLFFAFFTLFSSSSFFDVASLVWDSKGFASCGMCLTCCWWTHSIRPIEQRMLRYL